MIFKCDRCGRFVESMFYFLTLEGYEPRERFGRQNLVNNSVLCHDCALDFQWEIGELFKDEEYIKACTELREAEKAARNEETRARHAKVYLNRAMEVKESTYKLKCLRTQYETKLKSLGLDEEKED